MPTRDPYFMFHSWREFRPILMRQYSGPANAQGLNGFFYPHFITAWWLLKGSLSVETSGKTWTPKQGDWLIMPPQGRVHHISPKVELWSAHFYFETSRAGTGLNFHEIIHLQKTSYSQLSERAWELDDVVSNRLAAHEAHIPGVACSVNDYIACLGTFARWLEVLLDILAEENDIHLQTEEIDVRAHDIHDAISQMPLNEPLPLETIAKQVDMTVRHLNRVYSRSMHITPTRYFENRRLTWTQQKLANSEESIKSIAYELGFKHLSKFSNWFTRLEGCSPSSFRSRLDALKSRQSESS